MIFLLANLVSPIWSLFFYSNSAVHSNIVWTSIYIRWCYNIAKYEVPLNLVITMFSYAKLMFLSALTGNDLQWLKCPLIIIIYFALIF
jgi:hypothetical protein